MKSVQSYEFFYESAFGEVVTLVDVNPTILEDYKTFMHVDHEEKILYDSYIVEFLIMILHIIIMREENMVVEIFILLNYLSSC